MKKWISKIVILCILLCIMTAIPFAVVSQEADKGTNQLTEKSDSVNENVYGAGTVIDEVTADGFLYHMVRIMVGTLIEIGRGYWHAEDVKRILASMERKYAGPTALPQGLILWEVKY
jgi:tRNA pseudouridine(38-40) synthase